MILRRRGPDGVNNDLDCGPGPVGTRPWNASSDFGGDQFFVEVAVGQDMDRPRIQDWHLIYRSSTGWFPRHKALGR